IPPALNVDQKSQDDPVSASNGVVAFEPRVGINAEEDVVGFSKASERLQLGVANHLVRDRNRGAQGVGEHGCLADLLAAQTDRPSFELSSCDRYGFMSFGMRTQGHACG